MRITVETWYKYLKYNGVKAYNRVLTDEVALCINFIQIPATEVAVMTVTVMKNHSKRNALNPVSFAKVMTVLEGALEEAMPSNCSHPELLYCNVVPFIPNKWYAQLETHRVFFILAHDVFNVMKHLFTQQNVTQIQRNGISGITAFVETEDYNFNARFYA